MQVLINITPETYDYWKEHSHEYVLAEAIKNGVVLPETHGRLIDADELKAKYGGWYNLCNDKSVCAVETKEIDWMPTIINAELEEVAE